MARGRVTVRYRVSDFGHPRPALCRLEVRRKSVESIRYKEYREYRDGKLRRFWTEQGSGKANLRDFHYRNELDAWRSYVSQLRSGIKYSKRDLERDRKELRKAGKVVAELAKRSK